MTQIGKMTRDTRENARDLRRTWYIRYGIIKAKTITNKLQCLLTQKAKQLTLVEATQQQSLTSWKLKKK